MNEIDDYIISGKTGETFAKVQLINDHQNSFKYTGKIIANFFPKDLLMLIKEYNEIIEDAALSLLDDVEKEIYFYNLKLKDHNISIYSPEIKDDYISFYSKYPSVDGYVNHSPFSQEN